jgi:hypothetical protein
MPIDGKRQTIAKNPTAEQRRRRTTALRRPDDSAAACLEKHPGQMGQPAETISQETVDRRFPGCRAPPAASGPFVDTPPALRRHP